MEIRNLTSTATNKNNVSTKNEVKATKENSEKKASEIINEQPAAVYKPSESKKGARAKMDAKELAAVDAAIEQANNNADKLSDLVTKMLGQQVDAKTKAADFGLGKDDLSFATGKLKTEADIEAEKADDYWGVEKTAGRILDFAKALSGGDPSKIELLKNAAIKGFEEAMGVLGKDMDNMPQITKDTYDAVMKGFEEWANQSKVAE